MRLPAERMNRLLDDIYRLVEQHGGWRERLALILLQALLSILRVRDPAPSSTPSTSSTASASKKLDLPSFSSADWKRLLAEALLGKPKPGKPCPLCGQKVPKED